MPVYTKIIDKIFALWFRLNEKLRYLLVGGYNTVFAFLFFCFLEFLFGQILHYLAILLLCHVVTVLNSFLTFRFFVFRSRKNIFHEYIKINIVYAGYYFANATLLYFLIDWLKVNILLSQFICISILTVITYFAHKYFSFKND